MGTAVTAVHSAPGSWLSALHDDLPSHLTSQEAGTVTFLIVSKLEQEQLPYGGTK